MSIVDSSLWIEYFLDNDLDDAVTSVMEDSVGLYVPSICLYEVYRKFFSMGHAEKADLAVDIMQNAIVVSITPDIAIQAAKLGKEFGLPLADSIIYATAKSYNVEIYTQDKHFKGLDGVHYFAKP
jgi:predicted nucleic acid-binding protein